MTEHIPLTTTPLPVRLRVEDFFQLDEAGAFAGYGKTELIRGDIFYTNAQHRPHARAKGYLHLALVRSLAELGCGLDVLIEATVAMPPYSAPEPDLVLTSEPEGQGAVPLASVRLVAEIADTTQASDLGIKTAVYAENGVPEYWVVDLKARAIHQLWAPAGGAYAERRAVQLGERIAAATIKDMAVETAGI